jgi:hypothetical protein
MENNDKPYQERVTEIKPTQHGCSTNGCLMPQLIELGSQNW